MTILITAIDPGMSSLIWGVGGLIMLITWYFQIMRRWWLQYVSEITLFLRNTKQYYHISYIPFRVVL